MQFGVSGWEMRFFFPLALLAYFLGRRVDLCILEDNEATIRVDRADYSSALGHVKCTGNINLGNPESGPDLIQAISRPL